jgi:pyridoxamine 5'-phosphate oxidase
VTSAEHPDPIARFAVAWGRARAAGLPFADAVALATADAGGRPSVRMVLLKGVDERGFAFYTNLGSRKARELGDNPRAALCFHWQALGEQVRVEGDVSRVSDEEADAYFATRPRGSQIGAWASRQSRPIAGRGELLARAAAITEKYAGEPVPRPEFWSGFWIAPIRIEFWFNHDDRLHERWLYARAGDGPWSIEMLQP